MIDVSGFLEIILACCGIVGSLSVYFINAGKQAIMNETNEKRFCKIEIRQEKSEEASARFMEEIRGEFKDISRVLVEMKEARIEQKHENEKANMALRNEMKQHLELSRLDFLRIFGTKPVDELRREQL